jgi:nicotinamidase/pyrazinamidase
MENLMIDRSRSALLVVDIQFDFLPGGALGVDGGDAIIEPIDELLRRDLFARVVATQDWHPPGHVSFASSHAGREPFDTITLYGREQILWPDHCVPGSRGAEFHPSVHWERVDAIMRKGTDPKVDSYSAFRSNWNEDGMRPPTGLRGYLENCGLTDVYICGLARDFCVKWSAEDAADSDFSVFVIWDLTRPVDASSNDEVRSGLLDRGVVIVDSRDLG